jgi:6-phosphogluconolactonase
MPNLSRRDFSLALGATAIAAALPVPVLATGPDADFVYIGMHGNQITLARFDPRSGDLSLSGPAATMPSPTWSAVHPRMPVIYYTSEIGNDGKTNGGVWAFRINRATGELTKLNQVDAGGGGTTFLYLDAPSLTLLATNFGSGSIASFAIGSDGSLSERISLVTETGSGPNVRQKSAHAHSVIVDPTGRYALVADLGADKVFIYAFDRKTHSLKQDPHGEYVSPPGSGPRHVSFHPNGRVAYVFCELTADLQTVRWNAAAGKLSLLQTTSTNSADFKGKSSIAEIAVSRDGRFVYVSNRGENTLVSYSVNPASGELAFAQRLTSGGDPWSFTIHPTGRWLLVANEHTNKVQVIAIDPTSGKLTDTGVAIATPTPVSISFVSSV